MGTGVEFQDYLDEKLCLTEPDLRMVSPLTFAYIGDAVYDMIIRTAVIKERNCQVQKFHKKTSSIVNAPAQAELIEAILPLLTEEERKIYQRGRNAKPHSKAKNATFLEYSKATGFEALLGWLYLKRETARMLDLVCAGLETTGAMKTARAAEGETKT